MEEARNPLRTVVKIFVLPLYYFSLTLYIVNVFTTLNHVHMCISSVDGAAPFQLQAQICMLTGELKREPNYYAKKSGE